MNHYRMVKLHRTKLSFPPARSSSPRAPQTSQYLRDTSKQSINLQRKAEGRLSSARQAEFSVVSGWVQDSVLLDPVLPQLTADSDAAIDEVGQAKCRFCQLSVLWSTNPSGCRRLRTTAPIDWIPAPWCSRKGRAVVRGVHADGRFILDNECRTSCPWSSWIYV